MAGNVMERAAPPANALCWAKRSFSYGVRGSTERALDRGQVFKLEQLPNDRLLLDLGYANLMTKGQTTYACRLCGSEFVDTGMRDGHGKYRHESHTFQPPPPPEKASGESSTAYQNRLDEWAQRAGRMADMQAEQQDKHENEVAPLDLTNTTASREA